MLLALSATLAQWVVNPNPMQMQVVFIIPICLMVGICSIDIIFACNFSFLVTLQILCKVRVHHENWDVELLDLGKKVFSRANSMGSQSWCTILTYQNGNIINENICN
jgi:hypothetical protein